VQVQKELDGRLLKEMVFAATGMLEQNRAALDALNVFPVPDGDTGTNMSLTMMAAARELQNIDSDDVSEVADAFASGALKGARGNSGVILSQLIRGLARGAKGHATLTGAEFVQALKLGVETAYKAVMKPTEGTMLTVSRVAVEKSLNDARRTPDLLPCMEALIRYGEVTLQQTPDMLPVLKQAGVVDAGGAGVMCIYRGFHQAITGEVIEWVMPVVEAGPVMSPAAQFDGEILFVYCTEFFITNVKNSVTETQLERFRDLLAKVGDSAVVVGDIGETELIKVHVHSNEPGTILQEALKMGDLSNVKIENMREQHSSLNDLPAPPMVQQQPLKEMGMVAVVTGAGIASIFTDLTVDQLVEGGQSMNPSIEDIRFAIAAVPAKQVFVFPNNSNIGMAADEAAKLSDKAVAVIHTTNIPQGLAAALAFREDKSFEENEARMNAAITTVKGGQITAAVRDSKMNGHKIHKGDILGLFDKEIAVVGKEVNEVAVELLQRMVDEESSMITVLYGQDVEDEAANSLTEKLQGLFDMVDIETHNGGQPLYDYLFMVE